MHFYKLCLLICASLLPLRLFAIPVEFDTPDAHIVVVRALDSWSGDESASKESLNNVKDHKAKFTIGSEIPNFFIKFFRWHIKS